MSNGNDIRQYSMIIGIVTTLIVTGIGYGRLQSLADENTKRGEKNAKDIKELAQKLDYKIDGQNEKITKILVAVEQIKAKIER